MKRFRKLSKKQLAVFEQIAINNDEGHHPFTLKSLVKRGLITERREEWVWGWVWRYDVPLGVHAEWCQWCEDADRETVTTTAPDAPAGLLN